MAITIKPILAKLRHRPKCSVTVNAEIAALNAAMRYLAKADIGSRDRFMYHLTQRFYPEGSFQPFLPRMMVARGFDESKFSESLRAASSLIRPA